MRHARVRKKVNGVNTKPRLSVFRAIKHVYAQLIDDDKGETLVSASSLDAEIIVEHLVMEIILKWKLLNKSVNCWHKELKRKK